VNHIRHQHIYDLAELCVRHGIRRAVICPGSRSAPLALAFGNHPQIRSLLIPDERSAAFIALGMAQASGRPVVLICTSGTAALNFAPAVAEAYYHQLPLLVCTADRPPEWVGQRDGQTIDQSGIYGNHVKSEFNVQTDENPDRYWIANRMMNEAIASACAMPMGPVHLNFPFREPLYPQPDIKISYGNPRVIRTTDVTVFPEPAEFIRLRSVLKAAKKILLVAGQQPPDKALTKSLKGFLKNFPSPLLAEAGSNQFAFPELMYNADFFLGAIPEKQLNELQPDLIISWGQGIVSRHIRTFLRNHPASDHWHIQEAGPVADTFMSLTQIIRCQPALFFNIVKEVTPLPHQPAYLKQFRHHRKRTDGLVNWPPGTEAAWVSALLSGLPAGTTLQLANSLSVRYANMFFGKTLNPGVRVFGNRGTSGIDGCSSTAIGHHLEAGGQTLLLTGDVAFFYDRNAFWPFPPNGGFKVCLLNNSGGRIFSMIDGPKDRAEAGPLFIGHQPLTARHLCEESGIKHIDSRKSKDMNQTIGEFLKASRKPVLLEIFTDPENDRKVFDEIKNKLNAAYGK